MTLPRCKALVFDLDDTLYLERDYAASGFRAVAVAFFCSEMSETVASAFHKAFDEGRHGQVFDAALEAVGIAPDPKLISRMVQAYRSHTPDIHLQPDAERLLSHLPAGLPTALVSDGFARAQALKVEALGLAHWIEEIVLTDALPRHGGPKRWKPHPDAFRRVERRLGLSGPDLAYIADNPTKDFLAPRRLGWRTVQIARPLRVHREPAPSADHTADATIASLDQLHEVLDWSAADFGTMRRTSRRESAPSP